jgi:hypothetical protein
MKTLKIAFLALITITVLAGKTLAQSEVTRQVSGFHGISSGGSFAVHVKIDGTESLKIHGDPDIIKEIETEVENGILKIDFPHGWSWHNHTNGRIDIYVTAKSLSSLALGGSGSIDVEGTVKGEKARVSLGGSGSISSDVESASLHISVAGSGSIRLRGTATRTDISVAGSGNLNAEQLKADDAEIGIAGSGNVHLDVEKTLSAHIAGSGSVHYSGNATVTNVSSAGSGRVTKVK